MSANVIAEPVATAVDVHTCVAPANTTRRPDEDVQNAVSTLGHELKGLAHRSSHYLAGLVANMALGFISFPIFTRVFSVDEYGLMDLGQRLLLLLTVMSKAGIQNASLRFYNGPEFAEDSDAARRYYSSMFYGVAATSAATVVLFFAAIRVAPQALATGPLANLTYLLLALAVIRGLSSILWGFLRIEERTKAYNVLSFATKATTIAAVCVFLPWIGRTARTYFVGTLLVEGTLVAGMTVWLLQRKLLSITSFRWDLFRTAVAFGAPLIVYEFAFAILGSADRFLVRHYVGAEALGFYAVAHGLARNVNELLVTPLGLALVPMYMRIWTSDGAAKTTAFLTIAFDLFIVTSAGILAAVAASGHSLVVLLASAKYDGADRLIPIILAALFIYAAHVFVGAGLLIHKKTLRMAAILACSAVFNIGLNCVLLPRMGLMGGAISTLLSYFACIVTLAWASNRVLPLGIHGRSLAKYAIAAALAYGIATQIRIAIPFFELCARSTAVVVVYAIVLYAIDKRVRDGWSTGISWILRTSHPDGI